MPLVPLLPTETTVRAVPPTLTVNRDLSGVEVKSSASL